MTKTQLARAAAEAAKTTASQAQKVLECAMEAIKGAVQGGEEVVIRGFGTFKPKRRAARKARDISKGALIDVPEKTVPSFRPSKNFTA